MNPRKGPGLNHGCIPDISPETLDKIADRFTDLAAQVFALQEVLFERHLTTKKILAGSWISGGHSLQISQMSGLGEKLSESIQAATEHRFEFLS